MKELDWVRLTRETARYREQGMNLGNVGLLMMGQERNGYVLVVLPGEIYQDKNGVYCTTEKEVAVRVEDLEVVSDRNGNK